MTVVIYGDADDRSGPCYFRSLAVIYTIIEIVSRINQRDKYFFFFLNIIGLKNEYGLAISHGNELNYNLIN